MTFKEIDPNFATNLARRGSVVRNPTSAHKSGSLNPLQKLDLQAAVKHRKQAAMVQGRRYVLRYDKKMVFYQPADALAPCGWVDIERVLSGGYID